MRKGIIVIHDMNAHTWTRKADVAVVRTPAYANILRSEPQSTPIINLPEHSYRICKQVTSCKEVDITSDIPWNLPGQKLCNVSELCDHESRRNIETVKLINWCVGSCRAYK